MPFSLSRFIPGLGRNRRTSPDPDLPVLRRRTPFAHPKVPFITLWSQKSGCTTILKWHLFHAGLLDEALAYRASKTALNVHAFQNEWMRAHLGHRQRILRDFRRRRLPVINFMRDPWSRAFSCFLHSCSPGLATLHARGVENNAMRFRMRVIRDLFGDEASVDTAYSFEQYLDWLETQAPGELNPHHSPQSSTLYDLAQPQHFRLEDFAQVARSLEARYRLRDSSTAGELFTSSHHKAKSAMSREDALATLREGLPLARGRNFPLPQVNKDLLAGTSLGATIGRILERDIAIYEGIEATLS
ncbi:MAG: hypothetical protein AAGI11_01325 [Pseudomonadota bacterium]